MDSISQGNKRIAINTIIIYIRMILVAIIGLFTTRYVLLALGVSDYGLFNVVGGIVTMMSFISIAMITTTRRYVNIEMGKKENSDLNKIFNVCFVLHIGFALLIYIFALSVGVWYIYNMLNISQDKTADALFVFFISTTISAIGIVNVPYQALMTAFEKFKQIAIIDFLSTCFKVPLVVMLFYYPGNRLRFYAFGICLITFISFLVYHLYCKIKFSQIIKWKYYSDKKLYKEILLFNNYTSMGAFAALGRSQGSTMIINYFFGTIVNGSYAIAAQIETQVMGLVSNLGTAANPQMTQSYSSGHFQRSFDIVCKITKFSSLIMILLTFPSFLEIETLLSIWLHNIPEGSVDFCRAILISLFVRSLVLGLDGLIQATGKVRKYQIISSTLLISCLPIAVVCFNFGLPPVSIIYVMIATDLLRAICMFFIVCEITPFDLSKYIRFVYLPILSVMVALAAYSLVYIHIPINGIIFHFGGFVFTLIFCCVICFILGMSHNEKIKTLNNILKKL